jgi:hypothetical protein
MRLSVALRLSPLVVVVTTALTCPARAAEILYAVPVGDAWIDYGTTGYNAEIGTWNTPYPYGYDCDEPYAPGEPIGVSRIQAEIDVGSGGILSLDWSFRTYDNAESDTLVMYVLDAAVRTDLLTFGHRIACPGLDYEIGRWQFKLDLAPWATKMISFVIDVSRDGQGTQTQGRVWNLEIRPCPIAPLTPLSDDPLTQYLETHGGVDTTHVTQGIRDALACLVDAVQQEGGTVTVSSAYRTPEYQLHINELWNKWRQLRRIRDPACEDLKETVREEIVRHGLSRLRIEPAGSAGPHTQGAALDLAFGGPVDGPALAQACGLCRPIPVDTVHYQLCPGGL